MTHGTPLSKLNLHFLKLGLGRAMVRVYCPAMECQRISPNSLGLCVDGLQSSGMILSGLIMVTRNRCVSSGLFFHSRPVCLVTFFYLTSWSTQVSGVASSPVWNKRGYQPTPSAHEGWRGQPVIRPIVSFGRSCILSRLPYGFVLYPCYPSIITSSLPFKIMHNCPCGFIYPYIRHYRP